MHYFLQFLISFSCLCSWSWLRLFNRIVLNFLSDISDPHAFSVSYWELISVFWWSIFLFYLILYDLCIFVLVSVHLSKSSRLHRFSSAGKDFYLSFQLGILDVSRSIYGQVKLTFGVLVGQDHCHDLRWRKVPLAGLCGWLCSTF